MQMRNVAKPKFANRNPRVGKARLVLLVSIMLLLLVIVSVSLDGLTSVRAIEVPSWGFVSLNGRPMDVSSSYTYTGVIKQKLAQQPTLQDKESSLREIELFNGKNLDGWKATEFGGEGEVSVDEGRLLLEFGVDLTGVTWQKPELLPKTNYEVTLEVMRVDGNDFFCGLTFPVKDDPCSLIIGGWGGGVCGLSSIDGMDASENETTTYRPFENGRWYRIKLRVTDSRIDAWIDDQQIVEQEITGRKISIRTEVDLSRPFGIASWQTTAAIRKFRLREIEPRMESHKPADE